MRYTHLRAFHHVARFQGFSRAAQALNVSQPALSEQVRRLEQDHDTLLFTRTSRDVRLTPAGERLFRLTREFFDVEERIADHLDRSRAAPTGTLRIVADSAAHVTGAIARFRASHPGVLITLSMGNTERVIEAIRRYEAEIGVVGNVSASPDLSFIDLGESPIVAIAALGSGLARSRSFARLLEKPLIFREDGSRTRSIIEEEAARRHLRPEPAFVVEGREAMRELVAAGSGIAFVSLPEAGHDPRIETIPIADADLAMSEAIVTLRARSDVPAIRAFLKAAAG